MLIQVIVYFDDFLKALYKHTLDVDNELYDIMLDRFVEAIKKCQNNVKDGIIGFAIGDALGVPVEFKSREYLKQNPINDMIGEGTYNVPKGTWSDDTSMTLATMQSIINENKINYNAMEDEFVKWYRKKIYTATDEVFDIGNSTLQALSKYELGIEKNSTNCGGKSLNDNGNGSLMRMLPIAYFLHFRKYNDKEIYEIVRKVSSITHSHEISIMGGYIYVMFAMQIIAGKYKDDAYEYIKGLDYSMFSNETVSIYNNILKRDIRELKEDEIHSTGYIVDTLEAVLWLFLNGNDYNDTILKAVNLGGDTDTIGAITGGLLGSYYGLESINEEWKKNLKRIEYIEEICEEFYNICEKGG